MCIYIRKNTINISLSMCSCASSTLCSLSSQSAIDRTSPRRTYPPRSPSLSFLCPYSKRTPTSFRECPRVYLKYSITNSHVCFISQAVRVLTIISRRLVSRPARALSLLPLDYQSNKVQTSSPRNQNYSICVSFSSRRLFLL